MSTPLLRVEALRKEFGGRKSWLTQSKPVRAVDGVSFTIERGETLGLVGESGSGKSTLGRLILRLIEPTAGKIQLEGREITGLSEFETRRLRSDVQMVFQDPYGSLDPRMSIGATLAEPMKVHGMWDRNGPARLRDIMKLVGLDSALMDRFPHQFSGGQRQRIGIARALTLDPKLLVLDEPVSALDVSIQAQIINLLASIQRERGLAYIFIAHDLAVVRRVSRRVAVLYLGRIVELAHRERLYAGPRHPYTESLLSAVPEPDPLRERARHRVVPIGEIGSAANLPDGCRFHPRCHRARHLAGGDQVPARCRLEEPALVETASGDFVACHFPLEPVPIRPSA